MVLVISQKQSIIRSDIDPVSPNDETFSPRAQEIAILIENDYWVISSIENVYVASSVSGDTGYFYIAPAVWEMPPLRVWAKLNLTLTYNEAIIYAHDMPRRAGEFRPNS